MHDHVYDDEGRLVRTIVTREREWDDDERQNLLDLIRWDAGVGRCGFNHEWTLDPATNERLTPDQQKCPACAALDLHERILGEKDREVLAKHGDKPDPSRPWPGDGRSAFLRPTTPQEDERLRRRATAVSSARPS